ncbi:MAG: DEAD/DEAH box helicase [Candidatus Micrarchaeota archaeon]
MLDDFSPKWFVEKAKKAKFAEGLEVGEEILEILSARGVKKFYSHQAEAIEKVRAGKNIVLMAPTAAGKTECYMVPVVEAALSGRTSLLLFPTKALSRDQWSRIREFALLGVRAEVYDGDTPASKRKKIRTDMPHVIITNVDMLHFMLSNSALWEDFFSRLSIVVIDEVHAYSGILGSHVANVVWRLKRLCKSARGGAPKVRQGTLFSMPRALGGYGRQAGGGGEQGGNAAGGVRPGGAGSWNAGGANAEGSGAGNGKGALVGGAQEKLQFVLSSATIGNALEFSKKICGEELELVNGDGAPRGKINHAIVNEENASVVTSCLKIAKEMGGKTIIFANSHNMAERLAISGKKAGMEIEVYRSGIAADERRALEAGFHSGRVRCLAATSALELGMDVGDAQVAILAGFPGTVTRMRQRAGRVGRKGQESHCIMVARQSPLDQYYAANPKLYLEGRPEDCYANMHNENVRAMHLLAACKDRVLNSQELLDGDGRILEELCTQGLVREFASNFMSTKEGTIATRNMSMRNAGKRIRIIDSQTRKMVGEREISMAIGELYEGAIYLLGGRRYASEGINLQAGIAGVREIFGEESAFTQALKEKNAEITKVRGEGRWNNIELGWGDMHIVDEVHGYVVKDVFSGAVVAKHQLDEPLSYEFDTQGLWADWDVYADGTAEYTNGLHALEHVSISMMPAMTGADSAEIGGISYPDGRIFYYEGVEGGAGLSEIVMGRYGECMEMAGDRLQKCGCDAGCPKCIYSPQCGNNNFYLDKKKALELVRRAIGKK